MKANTQQEPLVSLWTNKENIDPCPQYQRGSVWNELKQQQLLDSLLRGYDVPKII